jgi:inosine-uridine nucleoside N-ribohydrolase
MKNYTIISDPGIDDLVALVLLYKLMPEAKNTLISTFGNAAEEITSLSAKEFIAFVAKSWRFINGSKIPLNGNFERPWPDYFHGPDGVWGIHPKVDIQNISTGNLGLSANKVISLATLTDPLRLLREKKVNEITIMGGAFKIEGNETKYAETNMAFDPDAAKCFFNELNGIKANVVPLDVTRKVYWSKGQIKNIPENNDINIWLKHLLSAWFDKYNHDREKDFNLHDPLAVYLDFFPEKAEWITSGITVITEGKKRGQTILSEQNAHCQIALNLKDAKKIAKEIYAIVFN